MSPARPGVPRKPPSRPPGRSGKPSAGSRTPRRVPLERGRAAGILTGLLLFGLGFAVAALVAYLTHSAHPAYLAAIGVGFFGIGCVAFFLGRGTVPLPEARIWSPTGLTALAEALAVPALAVQSSVYGLIGLGVLGNMVLPLTLR